MLVVSWSREAQQMVGHQPSSLLQALTSLLRIFTLRETPLHRPSPHSQLLPNFQFVKNNRARGRLGVGGIANFGTRLTPLSPLTSEVVMFLFLIQSFVFLRVWQWFHRHAYLKATCWSCEGHASVSPILARNSRRKGKQNNAVFFLASRITPPPFH